MIITEKDATLLIDLIKKSVTVDPSEKRSHKKLHVDLKNALFLHSDEMPNDVVRIGCIVKIQTSYNKSLNLELVLPKYGDLRRNKLSVMSPLGSAIVGKCVGEVVTWFQPKGDDKIVIADVIINELE